MRLPLLGDHQRDNATVATVALQLLRREGFQKIDEEAIRRGLESVEWPGRIQLIRRDPFVVVDAAHNEDSARRLLQTVQAHFPYERLTLVFGASEDKDLAGMARVLGPAAHRLSSPPPATAVQRMWESWSRSSPDTAKLVWN